MTGRRTLTRLPCRSPLVGDALAVGRTQRTHRPQVGSYTSSSPRHAAWFYDRAVA